MTLSAIPPHAPQAVVASAWADHAPLRLEDHDVIWDTPSADARGSMPLGNGDIALNAWVEANGDLLFYIGKTDSWDENSRLLKVGRVRVALSPNPFLAGGTFRQQLRLRSAELVVTATSREHPQDPVEVRVWVDANRPLIHVTVDSRQPLSATASIELWRTVRTPMPTPVFSDIYNECPNPPPTFIDADTVLSNQPDRIGWYHRNVRSVGPAMTMEFQDLAQAPYTDPLLHRTWGAVITAEHGRRVDDLHLTSAAAGNHRFSIAVLTAQPATEEQWLKAVIAQSDSANAIAFAQRRAEHEAWWTAFWERSQILIRDRADGSGKGVASSAMEVARGYNLQRFITACAGRGAFPIKFNGSIFVMPTPDKPGDADYRRWGPGYWWQNSRLPYISACAAGDYDLLQPFFNMYAGEVFKVCEYRTKHYLGIEGAYFPECIYPWGAVFAETYGWTETAAMRQDKLQTSGWHKWEWVCGLELVFMMQDYYEHTDDRRFLTERVIPVALPVLKFFANHYRTDANGKLVMHPSQSAETWWDCTNPMTEVAGLHAVIDRLLELPDEVLTAADRTFVSTLKAAVPPLPTVHAHGVDMLAPAERFADKQNCENPELYAVFPFRLVSFEKANAALGRNALLHRADRGTNGWRQDDLFMTYLGLADDAKQQVIARVSQKDPDCRFPAFWGPNFDWTPDQDHGGILMKAVQTMIMQTEGDRIFLLPAWPKDWEADFKLHAPHQTTVAGTIRDGKIATLTVTPASRLKDVIVLSCQ